MHKRGFTASLKSPIFSESMLMMMNSSPVNVVSASNATPSSLQSRSSVNNKNFRDLINYFRAQIFQHQQQQAIQTLSVAHATATSNPSFSSTTPHPTSQSPDQGSKSTASLYLKLASLLVDKKLPKRLNKRRIVFYDGDGDGDVGMRSHEDASPMITTSGKSVHEYYYFHDGTNNNDDDGGGDGECISNAKSWEEDLDDDVDGNDEEEAIWCYEQAIEADPTSSEAHYLLGRRYEHRGEYEKAKHEYQRAIELDPTHSEAHLHLGIVILKEIQHQQQSRRVPHQQNPKNGTKDASTEDLLKELLSFFDRSIELDGTNHLSYYYRALTLLRCCCCFQQQQNYSNNNDNDNDNYDEPEIIWRDHPMYPDFQNTIESMFRHASDPTSAAEACFALGSVLDQELQQIEEAVEFYRRAVNYYRNPFHHHNNNNDNESIVDSSRDVMMTHDHNANANNNNNNNSNNPFPKDHAQAPLPMLLTKRRKSLVIEMYMQLGRGLKRLGRLEEARSVFREAWNIDDGNKSIRRELHRIEQELVWNF